MNKERVIVIKVEDTLHLVSDKQDTGDIAGKVRDILAEAVNARNLDGLDFADPEVWGANPLETAERAVRAGKLSVGEMILWMEVKGLRRWASAINRNLYAIGQGAEKEIMTKTIESTKAHQPEAREYDPRAVAVIQSFIEQGMTHKEARAVFREAQILLCKLGDSTQLAAGPLSGILE